MPECSSGKQQYTSEQRAKLAIKHINAGGCSLKAYRCPKCYCWHLSSERAEDVQRRLRGNARGPRPEPTLIGSTPEPGETIEELAARLRDRRAG